MDLEQAGGRIRIALLASVLILPLPGVTGCRTASAPSTVTRTFIMATAKEYASHQWIPRSENVRHGVDARGIRVDTPDITWRKAGSFPGHWKPGVPASGIPYQWGGFATPEEFDRGIARGLAAGDVYTREKRRLLERAVSSEATGIDCSGFVSRCWNLPRASSTRELAALCIPLSSWQDLQPGDILNTWNAHVLLFSHWVDAARTRLAGYESGGPPHWYVAQHEYSVTTLRARGFAALRYRGILERDDPAAGARSPR